MTLEGTGWVDVRDIRLAGSTAPLQVTWTTKTTWQISVPLGVGANLITLEALNFAGEMVHSDSITVTNTGNIQVPTPAMLVVSEIYYNPPGSVETTEYIELMNASSTITLDLSNVNFAAGLDFTFPGGATLAPGARTLVVKDVAAFTTAFGSGKPIAGTFPAAFNLDNGGGAILLRRADGFVLHSFEYKDDPPWPVEADGDGYSLVLVNPRANPDHDNGLNWRASVVAGGSPGGSDSQSYAEWKVANGNPADDDDLDGDGMSTRLEYFLGGNPALAEQDLAPMIFREEDGSFIMLVARSASAEDVMPVPQLSTNLAVWGDAEDAEFLATERLSGSPAKDLLTFRVVPPPGALQCFVRFSFGP
ncbi:lamin tail domain-containing protein [Luteolibacter sp. Populi]|uniref:lamin tail domain-containing protein n=1 Tax=Luteolibacter sp. Populi TaxID=3230487 RepID=UPI003467BCB0